MKSCFKCSESKPLSEFYKHKAMRDGHLNKCKTCTKNDVSIHRSDNLEKIREYDRVRGCRQDAGYLATWRRDNPRKYAAHQAIYAATRSGKLKPLACELCGDTDTHAHHDDYAFPLTVRWLCAAHHHQWHAKHGEAPNGK